MRGRRRGRAQSGSAILEASLVLLPMLALLFALLDFPVAIFAQNTLRNAVREGVRYAITQQTCCGSQDTAIKNIIIANSLGFVTTNDITSGATTVTIQYYKGTTLAAVSGSGSNAAGNICVITASIQRAWMAPLWRSTGLISYTASSSDVMEAPANGILPAR